MMINYPTSCKNFMNNNDVPHMYRKHIQDYDIDALMQMKSVFNMRLVVNLKKWGHIEKAELMTSNAREKQQNPARFASFSLLDEFEQLVKFMVALNYHQVIITLPSRANQIDQYISALIRNDTLHHLHSPPGDVSLIYSFFNLMFLVHFIRNISQTLKPWIGESDNWS